MSARIFYPQALVRATITVQLSRTSDKTTTHTILLPPNSLEWESNDYNAPDTCTVKLASARFPVMPRNVREILLQVHAGDGLSIDSPDLLVADDDYIRFLGYVDEPDMELDERGVITWKARDFTALFLAAKRPPARIVPSYSDRLDVALRRICDELPGGESIKLRLDGMDEWPFLDLAVTPLVADSKIPIKADDTAWQLVKRACDPLALIPQIKLDTLVVSTSRGLRQPKSKGVFAYGVNLKRYKERRKLARIKEGVGLRAYSIADRSYIIEQYPPVGDASLKAKLPAATKKSKEPPEVDNKEKRAWFPYMCVGNRKQLAAAAERIHNERRFQEFDGSFELRRMLVPDALNDDDWDDGSFDVTRLTNGDRIIVDVLPEQRNILSGLDGDAARMAYLTDQGFEAAAATALLRAHDAGMDAPLTMYVKKMRHRIDDSTGYNGHVEFENLISADGSG